MGKSNFILWPVLFICFFLFCSEKRVTDYSGKITIPLLETQSTPTSNNLNGIHFVNAAVGWAVGDGGTIINTVDSGKTWISKDMSLNNYSDVFFIDENNGWIIGSHAIVLSTTNGGRDWDLIPYGTMNNTISVCFADPLNGVITGNELVYVTDDGGNIWSNRSISTLFYDVCYIDSIIYAVGMGGTVKISYNEGENWSNGTILSTNPLMGVSSPNGQNCWAVGVGGHIRTTGDYGASWSDQNSQTNYVLRSIDFFDTQNGITVGDYGTIRTTVDGGNTWYIEDSLFNLTINDVSFPDRNHAWIACNNGVIAKINAGLIATD